MQGRNISEQLNRIGYYTSMNTAKSIELANEVLKEKSAFTLDENIKAANVFRELAISLFNKDDYARSADYFMISSERLHSIPLSNLSIQLLRQLLTNYIDLADAILRFSPPNPQAAMDANKNAAEIFLFMLQNKKDEMTKEELALGNPFENFMAFHLYYEKQTSQTGFINSTRFKNEERFLKDKLKEDEVERNLNSLFVDDEKKMEKLFDNLTIPTQHHLTQTPLNLTAKSSDDDYRSMVLNFANYTVEYAKNGLFKEAIQTLENATKVLNLMTYKDDDIYRFMGIKIMEAAGIFYQQAKKDDSLKLARQSLEMFDKIREKDGSDKQRIGTLQHHLNTLQTDQLAPPSQLQTTNNTPRISTMGAFGPNGPLRAPALPQPSNANVNHQEYQSERMEF